MQSVQAARAPQKTNDWYPARTPASADRRHARRRRSAMPTKRFPCPGTPQHTSADAPPILATKPSHTGAGTGLSRCPKRILHRIGTGNRITLRDILPEHPLNRIALFFENGITIVAQQTRRLLEGDGQHLLLATRCDISQRKHHFGSMIIMTAATAATTTIRRRRSPRRVTATSSRQTSIAIYIPVFLVRESANASPINVPQNDVRRRTSPRLRTIPHIARRTAP